MRNLQKIAVDIYMVFKKFNGSITAISGFLGRDDSGKLSRQINPNDDRRDNFYIEILEVHREMAKFSPEMEREIWQILVHERNQFIPAESMKKVETAERINKVFGELGDVIYKNSTNADQSEISREAFELLEASKELYESTKPCAQESTEVN